MKRFFSFILIFITAIVLTACTKKVTLTLNDADKTIAMQIGDEVTVTPELTDGFTLNWTSSKSGVVTVTASADTLSAKIKAVSEGSVTVTLAVDGKDVQATITITVTKPDPTSVAVTGAGSVAIGNTLNLTASVLPATADQKVTWSSASTSVATVSASGVVTGVSEGTAVIKATSVKSSVYAEVSVTVVVPDPENITVTGPDVVILEETGKFTAVVNPSLAPQGVMWSTSSPSIATVDQEGVVTGVAAGTVKVRATSKTKMTVVGEKEIEVVLPNPTKIVVAGELVVPLGEKRVYTSSVTPSIANPLVVWSVSDSTKATIDAETGELTAVAAGKVTVKATSAVAETIVGELEIEVEPARIAVDFNLDKGYWPITGTDAFIDAQPKVELKTSITYNPTSAGYYIAGDSSPHFTNIFLQDANYLISPSVWQNRVFLNKNAAGFFEVQLALGAGSANANPDLSKYEYVLYAHEGYAAAYSFIGGLTVGDVLTLNGFEIDKLSNNQVVPAVDIKIYEKTDATSTEKILVPHDVEVILPNPSRLGYLFEGWYDNANLTGTPVVKAEASIEVYAKWTIDYGTIVVSSKATGDLYFSELANKYVVPGETAHATLAAALAKVKEGGTIYIEEGDYDEAITISKNGLTLTGEEGSVLLNKISVAAGVENLTVANLEFNAKGSVIMNAAGGVKGFTFKNNLVTDLTNSNNPFIGFTNNGTAKFEDFVITGNEFLIGESTNVARWLRGGNLDNLTVSNNVFEGIAGQMVDAIRIEGSSDLDTAGTGLGGVVVMDNNLFDNIGQRGVWIRRISMTKFTFTNNVLDKNGSINPANTSQVLGGGIQLETLVGEELDVDISRNTFMNIDSNFGIRIGTAAKPTLGTVVIKDNKFINFKEGLQYVDAFAGVTKLDANGNFYQVAPDAVSMKNVPVDAYATSSTTLDVTFDSNGGPAFDTVKVPVALERKATKPADKERLGYTFDGWFVDSALKTAYDFDSVVDYPFTLYAKWTAIDYEIEYKLNDGKFGLLVGDKYEMIDFFMDDLYAFVKPEESKNAFIHGVDEDGKDKTSGYDGLWHSKYIEKVYAGSRPEAINDELFISHTDYMNKWLPFFDMMEDFIQVVNSDQHFYANGSTLVGFIRIRQYIINTKPAAYVTDATMAMIPEAFKLSVSYTVADEVVLVSPSRAGYQFGGWYAKEDLSGEAVTKIAKGSTGKVTLYAKWIEGYDVTYSNPDGTPINIDFVVKGDKVVRPDDPSKTGYDFLGWYTSAEFTTEYVFDVVLEANAKIYAKWNEIEYDLVYELNGGSWSWTADAVAAPGEGIEANSTLPAIFMQDFYQYLKDNNLLEAEPTLPALQKTNWADFSANYKDPRAIYNWCSTDKDGGSYSSHTGYNQHFFEVKDDVIVGGFLGTEPYKSKYANLISHMQLLLQKHGTTSYNTIVVGTDGNAEGAMGFVMDGYFYGTQGAGSGDFLALRSVIPTPYAKYSFVDGVLTKATTTYEVNSKMYTAEALLVAPSREGYLFEGWYTNANFTGSPVSVVGKNAIPAAKYYAKWKDIRYDQKEVTFEYNFGVTEHVQASRLDSVDWSGNTIILKTAPQANWYTIALKPSAEAKVYEIVGKGGGGYSHADATLYLLYHDGIAGEYKAPMIAAYAKARVGDLIRIENLPEAAKVQPIDIYFIYTSETKVMSAPEALAPLSQDGLTFLGWYDNPELTGSPVTEYPGLEGLKAPKTVTYYAKWGVEAPGVNALSEAVVGTNFEGEGIVVENDTLGALIYVSTEDGLVVLSYYDLQKKDQEAYDAMLLFEEKDKISFSGVINKSNSGNHARAKHVGYSTTVDLKVEKIGESKEEILLQAIDFDLADLATLDYNLLGSVVKFKAKIKVAGATIEGTNYSYFDGYSVKGDIPRAGLYKVDGSLYELDTEYEFVAILIGCNNDTPKDAIFRFTHIISANLVLTD